jgi:hypothetical protein
MEYVDQQWKTLKGLVEFNGRLPYYRILKMLRDRERVFATFNAPVIEQGKPYWDEWLMFEGGEWVMTSSDGGDMYWSKREAISREDALDFIQRVISSEVDEIQRLEKEVQWLDHEIGPEDLLLFKNSKVLPPRRQDLEGGTI